MATAKIGRSGSRQTVFFPRSIRLKSATVELRREGNEIIIREKRPGKPAKRSFSPLGGRAK